MIENQPREITLIYNSEKTDDKKARGYVESLPGYAIKTLDLAKDSLTETQIAQIAIKMKENIEDLLDPTYDDHISVHKEGLKLMSRSEMLTLMANEPKLISTPILIIGNRAFRYGSAYELINKEMNMREGVSKYSNPGE
jgi:arsenate reductase-like glutaredoxin family protein